ncbi:MAG TPA: HdeD family acid-resistance protein [Trebonia sp.]|jgi:uncharacterized membrane protein HdeD (DUF308 family)|nr:HdeD family acid-resistance protein [Trebonia sp.]
MEPQVSGGSAGKEATDQPRDGLAGSRAGTLLGPLGWQAPLLAGIITLVLGIIVTALPSQSLAVIAVLLGILMIVSGIYHLAAVFNSGESDRLWHGIAGLLFIVTGIVLIRHLHLTVAAIGLLIGFTWVVQGVALLFGGAAARTRAGTGWSAFFGIISIIAGIVVVAAPIASVTVLATLMGIWFIVMGLMEAFAALLLRRAIRKESARTESGAPEAGSVPGQRPGEVSRGQSGATSPGR